MDSTTPRFSSEIPFITATVIVDATFGEGDPDNYQPIQSEFLWHLPLNPSTWEAEAGRSLSLRPTWSTA